MLAMFAGQLAEMYPKAKFILTFREPREWLNSIMNQHLNVNVSQRPDDRLLRGLLYGLPRIEYMKEEEALERRGLFTIDGYLNGWKTHYEWVLDSVPPERILVVRTEKLRDSVERIEEFLGIPANMLDLEKSYLHRTTINHGVLDRVPSEFVTERIENHCSNVVKRLSALMEGEFEVPSMNGDLCGG